MLKLCVIALSLLLGACGGSSGGDTTTETTTSTTTTSTTFTLGSFAIAGSAAADTDGTVPINPGVNGGLFTPSWEVSNSSSGTYNVELFVSINDVIGDSDTSFHSEQCMSVSTCNAETFSLDCHFDNANKIDCGDTPEDLTAWLPGLPQAAYIIGRFCDSTTQLGTCHDQAVPVRLE